MTTSQLSITLFEITFFKVVNKPEQESWDEVVQLGWQEGLGEVSDLEDDNVHLRKDQRRGGEEKLKTNKIN
jgi:hypothetical protein